MTGRQILKLKAKTLTDAEVAEVLDYIQVMQSMNEQTSAVRSQKPEARSQKPGVRSQKSEALASRLTAER